MVSKKVSICGVPVKSNQISQNKKALSIKKYHFNIPFLIFPFSQVDWMQPNADALDAKYLADDGFGGFNLVLACE